MGFRNKFGMTGHFFSVDLETVTLKRLYLVYALLKYICYFDLMILSDGKTAKLY